MKRFEVYKNIRKRAMIMGLPLPFFAMQMMGAIGSLLVVIFSFSFLLILILLTLNIALFVSLTQLTKNPEILHYQRVFPATISNKKDSRIYYETHNGHLTKKVK